MTAASTAEIVCSTFSIGIMEFTGTEDRSFAGKVPKADSSAPASHLAQTSSPYSGNGANSPQPEGPLINTPVRV